MVYLIYQLFMVLCITLNQHATADEILYADVSVATLHGVEIDPEVFAMVKYGESIVVTTSNEIWLLDPTTKSKQLIAGSPEAGYTDGSGNAARFSAIGGIVIRNDKAILSDTENHCIREVNLFTKEVSTLAGICEEEGHHDGPFDQAKFSFPTGILEYQSGTLVADSDNNAVRYLHDNRTVITLALEWPIIAPQYFAEMGDFIFVTIATGLVKLNPSDGWTAELIAGEVSVFDFSDGPFLSARFGNIMMPVSPAPGVILLPEHLTHRIRLLNFTSEIVFSICTGDNGMADGRGDICTLGNPRSMMIYDDRTAYFSQGNLIRSLSLGSFAADDNTTNNTKDQGPEPAPALQNSRTKPKSRCSGTTGLYQPIVLLTAFLVCALFHHL